MGATSGAGVGAASILILLLLLPPVVQTQDNFGVDYHHPHVCALKGKTVKISATYWHPDWATVVAANWLRQHEDHYKEVRLIAENSSRVTESCDRVNCILTIKDLRESDAAKYWLSIITDTEKYVDTEVPGVTLSLTDPRLWIRVIRPAGDRGPAKLSCNSDCHLTSQPVYTWYRNKQEVGSGQTLYLHRSKTKGQFSCGLSGFRVLSPEVYAPKLTRISRSPHGLLLKNNAVTLRCSSDAKPAARFTWYKDDQRLRTKGETYLIRHFSSQHYGSYMCRAHNGLGTDQSWQRQDLRVFLATHTHSHRTEISTVEIVRLSLPLSVLLLLLLLVLWCRTNKKPSCSRKKESTSCGLEMQPIVDGEA